MAYRVQTWLTAISLLTLLGLLSACGAQPAAQPTTAPAAAQPTTAPAATQPTTAPAAQPTASTSDNPSQEATVKAVATYSILADLVKAVGGERVSLTTLVGPGGDAHTYEPTPQDNVALAETDLVFENGLEFETWLDDLYTASASQATRVVVSEGITALPAPEEHGHDEHSEGEAKEGEYKSEGTPEAKEAHSEDEHGEFDPHVWHDPNNAMIMVERIRDALIAADAAGADTYRANAEAYLTQLKELDAFIQQEIGQLPAERRKLVTTHDTFGYFAQRYNFEIVGTALGSMSTEAADPAGGEMAELIGEIKASGVPAIFAENIANTDLMETIARDAGVQLAPTLFTDALGEAGSPGDTYLNMVRYNVTTIVTALKG